MRVRIDGVSTLIDLHPGDTILEATHQASLHPPFKCRRGECGTCRAVMEKGTATMRRNSFLTARDLGDGWILTCQATPTSPEVSVNYDARRMVPGLRHFLRSLGVNPSGRLELFFNRNRML